MKNEFKIIDINDTQMLIEPQSAASCTSCNSKYSCISTSKFKNNFFPIPVKSGAEIGDLITLEITNKKLYVHAFLLYTLPLLSLFGCTLLAKTFYPSNDPAQILFGISGLLMTIFLVKKSQ